MLSNWNFVFNITCLFYTCLVQLSSTFCFHTKISKLLYTLKRDKKNKIIDISLEHVYLRGVNSVGTNAKNVGTSNQKNNGTHNKISGKM